jgi:DNA-binding CsgD family transcriptional regulator/signal transduction histidine kinase
LAIQHEAQPPISTPITAQQHRDPVLPTTIPLLVHNLQRYTISEDIIAAIESERKHMASLLQQQLAEPLHLLLSQANTYEQSLSGQPIAQMAVSVLATIARQLLQQLRDLEADLNPHALETLGLAPALELLVGQWMRATSVTIRLIMERIPERLPMPSELALFRLTQLALTRAIRAAHATQITIRLERRAAQLRFCMSDNGTGDENSSLLAPACQRVEQLGGLVQMGIRSDGGFELTMLFPLVVPPILTPREMEVLQLLAEGFSNKQIATRLTITPRTVNFHLDHIYAKLSVNTRTEASIAAMRLGWIKRGEHPS